MRNAADGYLGDWLPHREGCRCDDCLLSAAEDRLRDLEYRIQTLIGLTCPRCERGDELFVDPDTRYYTHTVGGNYCDAHRLHSVLDTPQGRKARERMVK